MRATMASFPPLRLQLAQLLGCLRNIMFQYGRLAGAHAAARPDRAMELPTRAARVVLHGQRFCLALAEHARGQADWAVSHEAWDAAAACEEQALLMEHQAAV